MIGHPSQRDIEEVVCKNMIKYCSVISHDVSNAYNTFCSDLAWVKRKTIRKKPQKVTMDVIQTPQNTGQIA